MLVVVGVDVFGGGGSDGVVVDVAVGVVDITVAYCLLFLTI